VTRVTNTKKIVCDRKNLDNFCKKINCTEELKIDNLNKKKIRENKKRLNKK
jgi:hypothetical protein